MNSFSLWVGLGAAVGLWRVWRSAPERQAQIWLNMGLFVLLAALAGARAYYAWLNWKYFSEQPISLIHFWEGGLGWPGAALGAAIPIFAFTLMRSKANGRHAARVPLGLVGDRLYPLLPPLAITTWLGYWQATESIYQGQPSADGISFLGLRIPLALLAALILLPYFFFLEMRVKPLRPAGRLSGLAVAGLLANLLAASLLSEEAAPTWNGLRVDTWFAVVFLAALILLAVINSLVLRIWKKQSVPNV